MDELVSRATPIRADLSALPNQKATHYAAVTFDDGLENIVHNALPELEKRRIPSVLFIVTEVLGRRPEWEYFESDDRSKDVAMSEQTLRTLPSDLVTIGSHSMTHPVLTKLSRQEVLDELAGSRAKLERIVNRDVRLFSFPYGAFDERVIAVSKEAGYERVFTALPVLALSQEKEFVTGRVGVSPTDWPIEFRLKLAGAYRWLPYAYILKRRIMAALRGQRIPLKREQKRVA
jgi:peptidoglycan/xylan/chitin deacetylase (PgdA/CDA1 family)